MPSLHRKLSPSSSDRWMNCAGSIALIGDESSPTNQAAMMGTAAHKILQTCRENGILDASLYAGYTVLVFSGDGEEAEIYAPDQPAFPNGPREGWFMFPVDQKMVDGVQMAIDEIERVRAEMYSPEEFTERFLDMSWLDPRLGGTADDTLVEPFGWAHLFDYKNGYIFVPVNSDQFKQYAVGIAHEHPDCEGVRVTVIQPNSPAPDGKFIRTIEYTRDELALYEIQMKNAADATDKPNAPRRAGDWCEWCPAATRCKEHKAMLEEGARVEFDDEPPAEMAVPQDREELARLGRWVRVLDKFVGRVKGDIMRELMNGNELPGCGWKIVMSKPHRRILDPAYAAQMLQTDYNPDDLDNSGAGLTEEEIFEPRTLKTPAQLEKLGPRGRGKPLKAHRDHIKALVAALAIKPKGEITLVTEDDPREAVDPGEEAVAEFADEEEF